jgi:hypothetical protein
MVSMTTPDPRHSTPRPSFAMAMKDYTFIRPGIAVTISAATLVVALMFGAELIGSLREAATTMERGARVTRTLHRYNAGLEVLRQLSTSTDPAYRRPEVLAQRDSMRVTLSAQLATLGPSLDAPIDQERVRTVLAGLSSVDPRTQTKAREAMILLLAHQNSTLFDAAALAQRGVQPAALLLGLTVLAAGMLVVPMAWLYLRHKRGATIEIKV